MCVASLGQCEFAYFMRVHHSVLTPRGVVPINVTESLYSSGAYGQCQSERRPGGGGGGGVAGGGGGRGGGGGGGDSSDRRIELDIRLTGSHYRRGAVLSRREYH